MVAVPLTQTVSELVAVVAEPFDPAIHDGGAPVPLLDNIHPLVFAAAKNAVVPVLD